ncbi:CLUMA_CG009371, isoform A [Clunio marinus]|uniref:CLUMA_CG009371, isoform A n=1 Tax=Clunio marinus TaxID=568069 RepID=A0A1J1I6K7_9DIPT|nr:CLUMA_CG009371, isoform A [Clunio marinus]
MIKTAPNSGSNVVKSSDRYRNKTKKKLKSHETSNFILPDNDRLRLCNEAKKKYHHRLKGKKE